MKKFGDKGNYFVFYLSLAYLGVIVLFSVINILLLKKPFFSLPVCRIGKLFLFQKQKKNKKQKQNNTTKQQINLCFRG
jgi:hypothetical protein